MAWCEVSDSGLLFTVNVAKTLQASAYVKRGGVFHDWYLAPELSGEAPLERLEFGINLATLLECLKIFGGAPAGSLDQPSRMTLAYRASTACLCLTIHDGPCVTECTLHTLEIECPTRVELRPPDGGRPPLKLTIGSEALK